MVSTGEVELKRDDRVRGVMMVAAMAALMWVVEIVDVVAGDLDSAGIRPRDPEGLVGIVAAPFLHGGFGHLFGNTIPFVILGVVIALSGLARVVSVTAIVALVGGLGVWLVAPASTLHIGASGIVFGFITYLIARGLYIAANGATLFGRLLAGSLTMAFFTYAFVNIGMVSGILPVVGVPLPFMSYGGTALITLGIATGLIMSVARQKRLMQS